MKLIEQISYDEFEAGLPDSPINISYKWQRCFLLDFNLVLFLFFSICNLLFRLYFHSARTSQQFYNKAPVAFHSFRNL